MLAAQSADGVVPAEFAGLGSLRCGVKQAGAPSAEARAVDSSSGGMGPSGGPSVVARAAESLAHALAAAAADEAKTTIGRHSHHMGGDGPAAGGAERVEPSEAGFEARMAALLEEGLRRHEGKMQASIEGLSARIMERFDALDTRVGAIEAALQPRGGLA
jgi:hypothetical protein